MGTILGTAVSGLLLDYFDGWESVIITSTFKFLYLQSVIVKGVLLLRYNGTRLVLYLHFDLLQRSRVSSVH